MLIESAEYLPDWLKPETSENRVNYRSTLLIAGMDSQRGIEDDPLIGLYETGPTSTVT